MNKSKEAGISKDEKNITEAMIQPNVDPGEVAKFEAMARRWWDKESEFKPLHEINPLRLSYIQERAELAGKRVLDVGCGGGILSESMAEAGALVTGIDMGAAPLQVARLHQHESDLTIDYQQITIEDLSISEFEKFDVITLDPPPPGVTLAWNATTPRLDLCRPGRSRRRPTGRAGG